jgi:hypothetical protein
VDVGLLRYYLIDLNQLIPERAVFVFRYRPLDRIEQGIRRWNSGGARWLLPDRFVSHGANA